MKNQVLSIEQMKRLKKLGVYTNNASMCWIVNRETHEKEIGYPIPNSSNVYRRFASKVNYIERTFTLQDMLQIISTIKSDSASFPIFVLCYNNYMSGCWEPRFRNLDEIDNPDIKSNSPLEASYLILCWLAENGYLKGGDK